MHRIIQATYLFQKRNYCFHDQSHMWYVSWSETICYTGWSVCGTSGTICSMTCIICYTQTELFVLRLNYMYCIQYRSRGTLLDIRQESFLLSAYNLLKRLWTKCTQLKTFLTLSRTIFWELNISILYNPPEAEYLDVIGTKVFRVFLLAIHSHLY
jgi:hypothetical protein